jgi:hypothetical protein
MGSVSAIRSDGSQSNMERCYPSKRDHILLERSIAMMTCGDNTRASSNGAILSVLGTNHSQTLWERNTESKVLVGLILKSAQSVL